MKNVNIIHHKLNKMKYINKLTTVVFLMFAIHTVHGQNENITRDYHFTPMTPEAAALAKMVNYPVSYNTGLPQISIPLYEIQTGGMVLPVELVYHSGGFKINEFAGRVGLGWSLSCDLQITRTINGTDDFGWGGYINDKDMKQSNINNSIDASYSYPITPITGNFPSADELQLNKYELFTGEKDGMPDKFYYKLLNKSGSFFFQKDLSGSLYTIVPVPYDNIKIEFIEGAFKITDTDGTVYYFGKYPCTGYEIANDPAGYGVETSGCSSINMSRTTWKCMKINNSNSSDSITFTYSRDDKIGDMYSPRTILSYEDKIEYWKNFVFSLGLLFPQYAYESTINGVSTYVFPNQCPFYQLSSPKYKVYYGGGKTYFHLPYFDGTYHDASREEQTASANMSASCISGLRLSKIEYCGGKVEFLGEELLNAIRITDNSKVKTIQLYQSYQPLNYPNDQTKYNGTNFQGTNYLDSIMIGDDKYTLMYHDKYCFGNQLKGHDAWGYANKATKDLYYYRYYKPLELTIPRQQKTIKDKTSSATGTFDIGGSDITLEQPDEASMRKGILKRIVYPTGGFVDFDFESNKYEENYSDGYVKSCVLRQGGGLRIRSINYYTGDSDKASMQKYYRYGDFEDGVGIMADAPGISEKNDYSKEYKGYEYSQVINYSTFDIFGKPNMTSVRDSMTVYLPASSLDYTYAGGAPVYYTKVTEYQMDMGVQTGKTVYNYYPRNRFFDDGRWSQMIKGTNIPFIKVDWHLGALESVAEYNYKDEKFQLRHLKKNEYRVFQKEERPRVAYAFPFQIYNVLSGSSPNNDRYRYDFASFAGQYNLSIGKLLLSKETEQWLENAGDTITQTTDYYYDYLPYLQPSRIEKTNSNGSQTVTLKYPYDETGIYTEMKDRNIISPVIQETTKDNATNMEISKVRLNYRKENGRFLRDYIESSVQGKPLTEELRFNLYDEYENILQTIGRDLTVKSYLWGYNGKYLVAEIENASYATAKSLIGTTGMGYINTSSDENVIKTQLEKLYQMSYAMVNVYTWQPLAGIKRHISPQKTYTIYDYDANNRLKNIFDNKGNVIQTFNYNTQKSSANSNNLFYASIPRMESFNKSCGANQMGIYNYVGFGGQSAPEFNIDTCPEKSEIEEYRHDVCEPESNFVKITFQANMPEIHKLVFDFVKNGSIIATKTFSPKPNIFNQLDFYLPVGEYSVVCRSGVQSYDERNLKYNLTDYTSGTILWFVSKDTINFQSGHPYTIYVTN